MDKESFIHIMMKFSSSSNLKSFALEKKIPFKSSYVNIFNILCKYLKDQRFSYSDGESVNDFVPKKDFLDKLNTNLFGRKIFIFGKDNYITEKELKILRPLLKMSIDNLARITPQQFDSALEAALQDRAEREQREAELKQGSLFNKQTSRREFLGDMGRAGLGLGYAAARSQATPIITGLGAAGKLLLGNASEAVAGGDSRRKQIIRIMQQYQQQEMQIIMSLLGLSDINDSVNPKLYDFYWNSDWNGPFPFEEVTKLNLPDGKSYDREGKICPIHSIGINEEKRLKIDLDYTRKNHIYPIYSIGIATIEGEKRLKIDLDYTRKNQIYPIHSIGIATIKGEKRLKIDLDTGKKGKIYSIHSIGIATIKGEKRIKINYDY